MASSTIPPHFLQPEQHIHIDTMPEQESPHTFTNFLAENMNQWSIVFIIFMAELLMCAAIVVPGPISFRRRFMNQLSTLWNEYPRFRLVTKTIMFIIGGFFLDALRHMYMLYDATSVYGPSQIPGATGYSINKDAYLGFYKAERNAYLCGTTIFLFFMLYRFAHMSSTLTLLENKLASLEASSTPTTHYRTEKEIKDDVGRPMKNKIR